jgi:hypothetical protein
MGIAFIFTFTLLIILTIEEITLAWTISTHWNKYEQIITNVLYYFANENSKGY